MTKLTIDGPVISADHALKDPQLVGRTEGVVYKKSMCAAESIAA
jgi:hypothetical protein